MNKTDICAEELLKAEQGAMMVVSDLQAALGQSTAVEALVLLPLIKRAQELGQDIQGFIAARSARE